jgi:hypothetical protein
MKFNLAEHIKILKRTPEILQLLLMDLSDNWIYANEGANTWSPFDIMGHLIHGEKTDWIPRTNIIINGAGKGMFHPFDRFAQFENSKGKTISQLLIEFSDLRRDNIQTLESLNIDESTLEMRGIHPELGQVSLQQLISTWVAHDLNHIHQMTRVMVKNHKPLMGPWSKYFSLLNS